MANYSIEWLSKSCYPAPQKEKSEEDKRAPLPDKVQPHGTYSSIEVLAKISTETYSPSSPNNSCGYTSGSESEQGDDSEGEAGLHRRMRTKFTSDQIHTLENTFGRHKYLGATQRRKIAEKLHLSETQVKTWFQNRRMKLKRDLQDMRPEFFSGPSSLLLPPFLPYPPPTAAGPAFQHHGLSGQLPLYDPRRCFPPQQPGHGLPFPAAQQQLVHQPNMHSMQAHYYF
ncbi:hypothetical protein NHX12_022162 [Muraenolepis orangiensis]|uniref:Homeobox domain-containing protein n=1 Tax=Muraenolepis orangiensis TaxID=630683 RepID=A0A9Q0ER13_9TELE|nr:hypothetical protein NHX12_022162 [Muraenolepis orangiensis]